MTNMTVNSPEAEKALEAWGVKTAKVEEAEVVQEEAVSQFDKILKISCQRKRKLSLQSLNSSNKQRTKHQNPGLHGCL